MANIFLKIPNITGSITTQGYENTIALHSLSFNSERSITMKVGHLNSRESSVPYFSEVTITKSLDAATNSLLQALCNGKSIPQIEIDVCSTDTTPQPYVKYTLSNVMIAQHLHSVVAEGKPVEKLRLSYTQVQISYISRDASNAVGTQTVSGYNLATAQVC